MMANSMEGRHRDELAPEQQRLHRGEWRSSLRTVFTTRRQLRHVILAAVVCVAVVVITAVAGGPVAPIAGILAVGLGSVVGAEMKEAAGRSRRSRNAR
jgi:hypothetical protein